MKVIMAGCFIIFFILLENVELRLHPGFWLWVGGFVAIVSTEPLWKNRLYLVGILVSMAMLAQLLLFSVEMQMPWLMYFWLLFLINDFAKKKWLFGLIVGVTFIPLILYRDISFSLFYTAILALLLFSFWQKNKREQAALAYEEDWKTLLIEYRKLKRQLQVQEENARAEERTRIARDIHDNVGHQLTALAMQLEMVEITQESGEVDEVALRQAKELAKQSLTEMRQSVQALRNEELKGFSSVIQLIRRLESESHIQVNLITRKGALSAPLTNEQMITIYRIVQEGLTNAMRHAHSREVEVIFEGIANYAFTVSVKNKYYSEERSLKDGFGLTNLRERVEQLEGRFEVLKTNNEFKIEAYLPLKASQS
ncbi:hypothetical protein AJ85_01975 [Alkalihalobacillus alcalophilus ATCC 27647 = CGMCC 1.3604]|uniref:histidine kinase n=1 Tax=Alkalihalobacillus alcalophilus ATCC 27647 = CGMCC 1.3604 TaxID=1218173 RepID=A0A4S4K274_ALKAL|nr:sensor histidine kinase [Alkalihalobacillus alcalophilus]MED1563268.1 sensor histidine kinase [Alkalihalobacillus alcalophilus]THG91748.1 hypothetical protein AJ85_01975 [Alkalihalobacillus alcalophilus ATCC 27647 = CGMCC 1.3604]